MKKQILPVNLCLSLLGASQLFASQLDIDTSYLVIEERNKSAGYDETLVSTALLNSKLKIASETDFINVALNYEMEGRLQDDRKQQQGTMSQRIGASVNSDLVNEYLGANATITTNKLIDQNGNAYQYSVKPALTKSITHYSDLGFYYDYRVDRNASTSSENKTEELAFDLRGDMVDGRLAWRGRYLASSVGRVGKHRSDNLEAVDFESRFRVNDKMELDLSWAFKNRDVLNDSRRVEYEEVSYAAGLAWMPSQYYSISMKVKKRNDTPFTERGYSSVGSLTWSPAKRLRISVNYDDQFFDGLGGWQLNTSLDL